MTRKLARKIHDVKQVGLTPGNAARIAGWLSREDRRFISEAEGMSVSCGVCGHPVYLTGDTIALAFALVALGNPPGRYPSKMARDHIKRLGTGAMTGASTLITCVCGYNYSAAESARMIGRYLLTGQRQFMGGKNAQGENDE